jgi:hypothetical protein
MPESDRPLHIQVPDDPPKLPPQAAIALLRLLQAAAERAVTDRVDEPTGALDTPGNRPPAGTRHMPRCCPADSGKGNPG